MAPLGLLRNVALPCHVHSQFVRPWYCRRHQAADQGLYRRTNRDSQLEYDALANTRRDKASGVGGQLSGQQVPTISLSAPNALAVVEQQAAQGNNN